MPHPTSTDKTNTNLFHDNPSCKKLLSGISKAILAQESYPCFIFSFSIY